MNDNLDLTGGVRCTDSERCACLNQLTAAVVSGALPAETHAARVEQAFAAKTRDQLDRLISDLPAPRPSRWPYLRGVLAWAGSIAASGTIPAVLLYFGAVQNGFVNNYPSAGGVLCAFFGVVTSIIWIMVGGILTVTKTADAIRAYVDAP